jgi:putative membrane protein
MNYGEGKLYSALGKRARVRRNVMSCMAAFIIAGGILTGCDKDDDNNDDNGINDQDRNFVTMASMSNYAEIQAGQVASTKAQNEGIAEFGEMMVTDHTGAGTQLKSIAEQIGLPAKDSLDAAHVRLMDTLAMLSGSEFDSVYINSQIRDHQMAISLFQDQADNGENADLRSFASDLLPHLEMHLQHADSLRTAY